MELGGSALQGYYRDSPSLSASVEACKPDWPTDLGTNAHDVIFVKKHIVPGIGCDEAPCSSPPVLHPAGLPDWVQIANVVEQLRQRVGGRTPRRVAIHTLEQQACYLGCERPKLPMAGDSSVVKCWRRPGQDPGYCSEPRSEGRCAGQEIPADGADGPHVSCLFHSMRRGA